MRSRSGAWGSAGVEAAARRWTHDLAGWAVPDEILARAPEPPWGFPAPLFTRSALVAMAESDDTPSRRRAREALGSGGTVLDVGSGSGAASLPLAPAATHVTALDESAEMLDAFEHLANERSLPHRLVQGRWPDAADNVPPADVVVCHHVVYNVADLVPFLRQLTTHARRRVVIELTEAHPMSDLNAAWRHLHGAERPGSPVADDVVALLEAAGVGVNAETFQRPLPWEPAETAERVALARRRLCVGPDRDAEIAALLPAGARRLVALWWDGQAAGGADPTGPWG